VGLFDGGGFSISNISTNNPLGIGGAASNIWDFLTNKANNSNPALSTIQRTANATKDNVPSGDAAARLGRQNSTTNELNADPNIDPVSRKELVQGLQSDPLTYIETLVNAGQAQAGLGLYGIRQQSYNQTKATSATPGRAQLSPGLSNFF
jgi:hypothetical protein